MKEGEKNSERTPDVFQLDIRVDRTFNFSNWSLTAYLDLWNVTNHDNVVFYDFDVNGSGEIVRDENLDFKMMPIAGINARF